MKQRQSKKKEERASFQNDQKSGRNRISMMRNTLQEERGEGYVDVVVGVFCLMLVLAFALSFLPIFQKKQQLDIFATELVREAEIRGSTEVGKRIESLQEQTGLYPKIQWECDYYKGHTIQLNDEIKVVLTEQVKLGMFGLRSFSIELQAKATGRSEVYYK